MKKLTRQQVQEKIEAWVTQGQRLESAFDTISDAGIPMQESPLFAEAWGAFEGYTDTLAELIGDMNQWLDWFAYECKFGKEPKEMQFADGETLLVIGASDLVAAIRTDRKGNWTWD